MALMSMTGFADRAGTLGAVTWAWEARSVNGRGLDLRLRLADGCEALEAPLRTAAGRALARGSVTIGLRIGGGSGASTLRLNETALAGALDALQAVRGAAEARGMALAPLSAGEIAGLRGVLETDAAAGLPAEVLEAMASDIEPLLADMTRARAAEGAALAGVLAGQIHRIAELTAAARVSAEARLARSGGLLRARVEALMAVSGGAIDEARLAQELAQIAVKVDLSEEIDRLDGHVATARKLVGGGEGPVGRKLDFLTQEFNREANTLCSKAQAADLTAIGLELKVVIDQMREQVQNVE